MSASRPMALTLLALVQAGCTTPRNPSRRAVPDSHQHAPTLEITETGTEIVIRCDNAHVLTYHKAEMAPPAGASPLYRRSGFIHPVTAPNGGVVTGIHPSDHIHHLGIWHAWVKTVHDGREVDFWNLAKGTATVRFAHAIAIRRSAAAVGFTVAQHHLIRAQPPDPEQIVLEETLSIDVQVHANGHYLVDYVTVQENVTDTPLYLPAYRYGGCIAYRGPAHWTEHNSAYLTSEGRGREDGHETRARWCAMSGPTDCGIATITILGHPDNHDAPQRQRIWPATPANKGAVFFNFAPTQATGWALQPNAPSTIRYRLVLSDRSPEPNRIEGWFAAYARAR